MCLIISAGGVPSALAINVTFGCFSATSTCGVAVASVQPRSCSASSSLWSIGHAVVGEDLARELQMLLRHERIELLLEHLWRQIGGIHALVLVRNDDVDAVGMVADVLVDPLQLDLELIRRVSDRAEHAEPACLAHGDDDVPAVGEREDRELDVELVADGGVHGCSSVGGVAN